MVIKKLSQPQKKSQIKQIHIFQKKKKKKKNCVKLYNRREYDILQVELMFK